MALSLTSVSSTFRYHWGDELQKHDYGHRGLGWTPHSWLENRIAKKQWSHNQHLCVQGDPLTKVKI